MRASRRALRALILSMLLAIPAFAEPWTPETLTAALARAGRPETDTARDAGRKPAEVVAFLQIGPGMTVIDLIAASGYYTEVLATAVGSKGKVYAQNNAYVLRMSDGANEKAISERLADARLPNVERLDREMQELGLETGSIDAAMTALNFHDIVNGRGAEATAGFLATVHGFLKPGGVLGLIDHDGDAGQDNESLHRIPKADVVKFVEAAGFVVEGDGAMLRNPADDHTKNVFDPSIRGSTDRFVLRLRKPVSES